MTTRAGRPFLYIHVSGLREIILPLSGEGLTDVSDSKSPLGVCPYMRANALLGILHLIQNRPAINFSTFAIIIRKDT